MAVSTTTSVPRWVADEFSLVSRPSDHTVIARSVQQIQWPEHLFDAGQHDLIGHQTKSWRLSLAECVLNELFEPVLASAKAQKVCSDYDLIAVFPVIEFAYERLKRGWPNSVFHISSALCVDMGEALSAHVAKVTMGKDSEVSEGLEPMYLLVSAIRDIAERHQDMVSDGRCNVAQFSMLNAYLWSQVDRLTYRENDVAVARDRFGDHLVAALQNFVSANERSAAVGFGDDLGLTG